MVTIEYLDDERTKLWAQINELKAALGSAVEKLTTSDQSASAAVEKSLTELKKEIDAVKSIADAKTPEDVQTARRAAQEAVKIKDEIRQLATDTAEAKEGLASAKKAFKQIEARDVASATKVKEVEANEKKIVDAKITVDGIVANLNEAKAAADNVLEKLTTASGTATPQAQEIANLKAKASSEFSEIAAIREKMSELQTELANLKMAYDEHLVKARNAFSETNSTNAEKLTTLYEENKTKLNELSVKINDLLPGATSVALATAFDERKQAVEKYKWVWAVLLVLSAVAIVCFGCWFLSTPTHPDAPSSLPIRFVIIAGLVMVEEFARRNFNVATRLAEAYAYKEAISKSYLGFKKEMTAINMPEKEPGADTSCVSVLVKTFLDKLGDEPGKKVFDKERRALGVIQAITQMNSVDTSTTDPAEKAKIMATAVSAFTRISWPLVALVSVLAVAGCAVAYILSR